MTTLRITFTSASYDEDYVILVRDSPKVRHALKLRAEVIQQGGDGGQDVEVADRPANTSEDDFIDWIVADISQGDDDDEIYDAIEGAGR